jgi:hypothetical protein
MTEKQATPSADQYIVRSKPDDHENLAPPFRCGMYLLPPLLPPDIVPDDLKVGSQSLLTAEPSTK